jgi:hypothetical protein
MTARLSSIVIRYEPGPPAAAGGSDRYGEGAVLSSREHGAFGFKARLSRQSRRVRRSSGLTVGVGRGASAPCGTSQSSKLFDSR